MKILILAVGKRADGPEARLTSDFLKRIDGMSSQSRVGPARLREIDAKGGREQESARLLDAASSSEVLIALDERGAAMTSRGFAEMLGRWRDDGVREAAFALGGADGHAQSVRDAARSVVSFGAMTWPHGLARVMLVEQLYRAATLLVGHPYHRD